MNRNTFIEMVILVKITGDSKYAPILKSKIVSLMVYIPDNF